ncbi:hypothetical protein LMG31506_06356 [Cupriavidus yeoncheonensis]|uniref:Copper resistance protein CopQ n=1 Tax=Cupriavidus yeoncheonensis TaxID=1462994 RepID=A0A916IZN3_9BURK|nr:hypothetical protein [Cupriavidus yeoncheonensis]CAG2158417.1 hypothetical protein LMG31506_06356 [Cupriavidus yeoncheonensis]
MKRLSQFSGAALLIAAAATFASQAAVAAVNSPRDVYTDGARIGQQDFFIDGARVGQRDAFTDGARFEVRDVYTDGARNAALNDRIDGVRTLAGMDRTGPWTLPARSPDPYSDGALA